jgi:hypothetical protein
MKQARARDRLAARRHRHGAAQDQCRRRLPRRRRQIVRHSLPHLRCLAGSEPGAGAGTSPPAPSSPARDGAVAAHRDGAVWIGHAKRESDGFKLPATLAFAEQAAGLPESPLPGWWRVDHATWQDIAWEKPAASAFLHFEFYNGAMSTTQCRACAKPWPGRRHGRCGDRARRRGGLLVQRHPPQRHRAGRVAGRRILGQHQRHGRPGAGADQHRRPADDCRAGRQCRCRRLLPGARGRPGLAREA